MRLALALCLLATACDSSKPAKPTEDLLGRVKSGPYSDTTALEMNAAYLRNSVSADAAYKGKTLRIRGKVERVGQDAKGLPLVLLRDLRGDEKTTQVDAIQCAWGDDRALVAKLTTGDIVTLGGIGAGTVIDRPLLASCARLPDATSKDVAEALATRPAIDPTWWRRNLDTFLEGKEIEFDVTYVDTAVTITTKKCDRARLAVEQLGPMPDGYIVECVAPAKGDAGTVQWKLPE
jgi:hypothetical protein